MTDKSKIPASMQFATWIAVQQPDLAETTREFGMGKCQPIRMLQASSFPLGPSPNHSNKYISQIRVVIPKDNQPGRTGITNPWTNSWRTKNPRANSLDKSPGQIQISSPTGASPEPNMSHFTTWAPPDSRSCCATGKPQTQTKEKKRKEKQRKKKKSKGKSWFNPPRKSPGLGNLKISTLHNHAVLVAVRFEIPRCSFGRMQKTKARLADGNLQVCVVNSSG